MKNPADKPKSSSAIAPDPAQASSILSAKSARAPKKSAAKAISAEEAQRLLHQLQVQQSELETQNEELRNWRAQAEATAARYADLYEFAPVGYFTLNNDGTIRLVNATGAGLLVVHRAHLVGQRFGQFVSEDSSPLYNAFLHEVFAGQAKQTCNITLLREGNHRFWAHLEATTADDGQGGLAMVVLDMTEHKRAEEALRESDARYRHLHESMIDAFVSVSMDGRILDFNRTYQTMLGYSAEELRTLTYTDITPSHWHAFEARLVAEQILPHGHSDVYEKEYRRKDGVVFPVELRTSVLRDASDQPAEMWAIVRDITQRKQTEGALREREFWLSESQRVGRIGSYALDIRSSEWTSSAVLDDIFGIEPDT
jgi:PAS domain S-box-containing protein